MYNPNMAEIIFLKRKQHQIQNIWFDFWNLHKKLPKKRLNFFWFANFRKYANLQESYVFLDLEAAILKNQNGRHSKFIYIETHHCYAFENIDIDIKIIFLNVQGLIMCT